MDETAIATTVKEQRRLLADAQSTSKAARRAAARWPENRSMADLLAAPPQPEAGEVDNEGEARIPPVVVGEAWKTEFLS